MSLRELLDVCQASRSDNWIRVPGGRPATAMLAAVFDPGMEEPRMRTMEGHSIAVFEPDPRLSMVWSIADEPEAERQPAERFERFIPEWLGQDDHEWKSARDSYVVVLLGGSPIWQERIWYLDWGSGVGGFVPDIQPVFGPLEEGVPSIERWETTKWHVGLARLISSFEATGDWYSFEPTERIVPEPSGIHPVDP
ncbi:MAG TPA: hypothetical protein VHR18_09220 [Solirubrobacterales bacterium]|jgi:hypothetical protein|nr:hypothetical protein [Solirubrobacterales bacterium]